MKRSEIETGEEYLYKGQPGVCGSCRRVRVLSGGDDVRSVRVRFLDGHETGQERPVPASRLLARWEEHEELEEHLRRCCELKREHRDDLSEPVLLAIRLTLEAAEIEVCTYDDLFNFSPTDFEALLAARIADIELLTWSGPDGRIWAAPHTVVFLAQGIASARREAIGEALLRYLDRRVAAARGSELVISDGEQYALGLVRSWTRARRPAPGAVTTADRSQDGLSARATDEPPRASQDRL